MSSRIRKNRNADILIGQKLRHMRKQRGFSLQDVGDRLTPSLTAQQIQKYELGYNGITASRLYALARLLDAPPAYFLPQIEGVLMQKSGELGVFLELIERLSDEEKRAVLVLLQALERGEAIL